jgi:hypothetical protein
MFCLNFTHNNEIPEASSFSVECELLYYSQCYDLLELSRLQSGFAQDCMHLQKNGIRVSVTMYQVFSC